MPAYIHQSGKVHITTCLEEGRKEDRKSSCSIYIYIKLIISVEEVWEKENRMQMLAEIVSALTMREPSG